MKEKPRLKSSQDPAVFGGSHGRMLSKGWGTGKLLNLISSFALG